MEKYSVLMSVYVKENPEFLLHSIESIFAQTVLTDDFVLVCDGELTDGLDAVICQFEEKYPDVFRVLRFEKNRGLGPALNDGLKQCRNRLVARMDSDDVAPENRCELQLQAFEKNPELAVVGGLIKEFEGTPENIVSEKHMPLTHDEILVYAKKRCPFNHPTVMYDKTVVLENGGYPDLLLYEDYGLWAELLLNGAVTCNLPEVLCYMRVDSGLYDRRGGYRYLKTAVKFRWTLYKKGFVSLTQFLFVTGVNTVVCLVPTSLRKFIYKIFLRK